MGNPYIDPGRPGTINGAQNATNVTAASDGSGGAISGSGTITTGSTAQQFVPLVTGLRGYFFQNQSTGPLYIRSKGANGTLLATLDQNSFRVDAGGVWIPPQVSDYGYTVNGATTGQAFHCLYW